MKTQLTFNNYIEINNQRKSIKLLDKINKYLPHNVILAIGVIGLIMLQAR